MMFIERFLAIALVIVLRGIWSAYQVRLIRQSRRAEADDAPEKAKSREAAA